MAHTTQSKADLAYAAAHNVYRECGEEAEKIKEAVETAGLVFGEFETDFNAFAEFGGDDVYRRWGGWAKEGNDWVVAGNSLEEIQGQLSRLDETMGD